MRVVSHCPPYFNQTVQAQFYKVLDRFFQVTVPGFGYNPNLLKKCFNSDPSQTKDFNDITNPFTTTSKRSSMVSDAHKGANHTQSLWTIRIDGSSKAMDLLMVSNLQQLCKPNELEDILLTLMYRGRYPEIEAFCRRYDAAEIINGFSNIQIRNRLENEWLDAVYSLVTGQYSDSGPKLNSADNIRCFASLLKLVRRPTVNRILNSLAKKEPLNTNPDQMIPKLLNSMKSHPKNQLAFFERPDFDLIVPRNSETHALISDIAVEALSSTTELIGHSIDRYKTILGNLTTDSLQRLATNLATVDYSNVPFVGFVPDLDRKFEALTQLDDFKGAMADSVIKFLVNNPCFFEAREALLARHDLSKFNQDDINTLRKLPAQKPRGDRDIATSKGETLKPMEGDVDLEAQIDSMQIDKQFFTDLKIPELDSEILTSLGIWFDGVFKEVLLRKDDTQELRSKFLSLFPAEVRGRIQSGLKCPV